MKDDNVELDQDGVSDENIYSENDVIKIEVIGYRFEINDSSIYILAKIIEKIK